MVSITANLSDSDSVKEGQNLLLAKEGGIVHDEEFGNVTSKLKEIFEHEAGRSERIHVKGINSLRKIVANDQDLVRFLSHDRFYL